MTRLRQSGDLELRPVVTEADVEAYLDIRNRVEPADPLTLAGFHASRRRPDRIDLLALLDRVPVGMGFVGRNIEDPASRYAFGRVGVLREQRRRGIGTELFRALSEHARSLGRHGLVVEVRQDEEDARDYLRKREYETVLRSEELVLDLGSTQVRVGVPVGVDIVPLVGEPLERLAHDATVEIARDLPAVETVVTPPFNDWRAEVLGGSVLRRCSFAAVAEGVVVGVGFLYARPWGAVHGLTGVRAACRRRGIARAIKCAQIHAAKAAGLRELRTSNEEANAPIRRLNQDLGYRPLLAWVQLRGPLIVA